MRYTAWTIEYTLDMNNKLCGKSMLATEGYLTSCVFHGRYERAWGQIMGRDTKGGKVREK